MCDPVTATLIAAGVGLYSQQKAASSAASSQKTASDQAAAAATQSADQADQAFNKANGKKPNVAGMMADNQVAAQGGVSGTMLTGPQGIDPKTLMLGKSTLLGG